MRKEAVLNIYNTKYGFVGMVIGWIFFGGVEPIAGSHVGKGGREYNVSNWLLLHMGNERSEKIKSMVEK